MLSVRVVVRGQARLARADRDARSPRRRSRRPRPRPCRGAGTITSRTTVSPNSKIEWMSSRSSVSIAASCGGDVGHREDLVLGDERARRAVPCPGSTTLASPMKPRVSTRSGGKSRDEREQPRRSRSAARSLCCTANVFGATSRTREHDEDLEHDAERDARGAERRLEHGAEQRRRDHLAAEHEQQDAVERLLGVLEQARSTRRRACRPPRRARAPDAAHARGTRSPRRRARPRRRTAARSRQRR